MDLNDLFPNTAHSTGQEIEERLAAYEVKIIARANCGLCDNDGYRPNGLVCDHVNRFQAHVKGMRKVRRALAKTELKSVDGEAK